MGGHVRRERRFRHARLGVDFETDEFAFIARRPAEVKVGAAHPATTLGPMGPEREVLGFMVNNWFKIFRRNVKQAAFCEF